MINNRNFEQFVETSVNENYLADINEDTVDESEYEVGIVGTMRHICENEETWNQIQQAIALTELKGFIETGDVEYVIEGVNFKEMFDKIIAWFRKAFATVIAAFKKFVAYITSKIKTDKGFIKKFGSSAANLAIPKGFQFKGYVFTNCDDANFISDADKRIESYINSVLGKTIDQAMSDPESTKAELDEYKSNYENILGIMRRKALMGGNNPIDKGKDYKISMVKLFRNNSQIPVMLDVTQEMLKESIQIVSDHSKNVKAAKESMNKIKDSINKIIGEIKKARNDIDKSDKAAKSAGQSYANAKIKLNQQRTTILTKLNGELITALHQRNSQAKSLVYAVYATQGKGSSKKSTNESGSLFAGIDL